MSGTVQGELNISSCITGTEALKGKVLLVDDMVDSGITLEKVVKHLKSDFPEITEIRIAVLWWKERSVFQPDYFVSYLEGNPWIHQPFEAYDDLGIERLREKRAIAGK